MEEGDVVEEEEVKEAPAEQESEDTLDEDTSVSA